MRRRNLDLLIALLDAVRRRDRDGILALLDPGVEWIGIQPQWHCRNPEEVADMLLMREEELGDLGDVELLARDDRAVLHLRRLAEVRGTPLSDGIYITCLVQEDRITRIDDHRRRRDALPGEGIEPGPPILESPLERGEFGLLPQDAGWFVLNARDAHWLGGPFGAYTRFEGDARFPRIGINIGVLEPGQPSAMYHREDEQEDFLVLRGECLLIVEEQERRLKQWDFVHCPPWTTHIFVGAGEEPCTLLAIGGRDNDAVVYPRSDLALGHDAGVEETTPDPDRAYEGFPPDEAVAFRDDWLP
jgi:uncharacterized cupin superfamily protein/ketosteroid isomerase-like protein